MSALLDTPQTAGDTVDDDVANDPEPVQLKLPTFEGQKVNTARLSFSGNILVEDQELAEQIRLGREVALIVRGRVVSRQHREQRDKENAIVGVVSSGAILVDGIELYAETA